MNTVHLILAGSAIVAVADEIQTDADGITTPAARYPYNAGITEAVEWDAADLPDDFALGRYEFDALGFVRLPDPPPPPLPVPQIVSRFQARAAMLASPATAEGFGNLLEQIDAAVAASDNAFIRLAWAEAVEWNRSSPTVNAIAGALGVTGEQLDDLFRAAAGIEA
jgi:hypothetical protein